MENPSPETEPADQPIKLDYAQSRLRNRTPVYVRILGFMFSLVAIVLAITIGCGAANLVWGWVSGMDTADGRDGIDFLFISAILLASGIWVAFRVQHTDDPS